MAHTRGGGETGKIYFSYSILNHISGKKKNEKGGLIDLEAEGK